MANAQRLDAIEHDQEFLDELSPGSTLMHGQYTIEAFLNAGGFGITYSARDSLDRRVAIKECFPGSICRRSTALVHARSRAHMQELTSIVRLFVQEAHNLSKLDHPNIVGVHQVFEENNTAYMALDFVEGRDLLGIIESGGEKPNPDEVEVILRKVLDAVAYIHRRGVLHRDISPDNILLDGNQNPILIDFGAAREEASKKSRVLSAMRVVKDGYSPQEFYISGSAQGAFSDIYALGATFYHLIAGELPPSSQARLSAVAAGDKDPYHPLAGRVPGYRDDFLNAIDAALEILPQDRIETAEAWLARLDGNAKVIPLVRPAEPNATTSGTGVPARKRSSKAVLMASVVLVAGIGIYLAQGQLWAILNVDSRAGEITLADAVPAAAPSGPTVAVVDPAPVFEPEPLSVNAIPMLAEIEQMKTPDPVPTDAPETVAVAPVWDHVEMLLAVALSETAPGVVADEGDTTSSGAEGAQGSDVIAGDGAVAVLPVVPEGFHGDIAPPTSDAALLASIDTGSLPEEVAAAQADGEPAAESAEPLQIVVDTVEPDMSETAALGDDVLPDDVGSIQPVALPTRQETVFPNGYAFATTESEGVWKTLVIAAPNKSSTEIRIGDVIVGDLSRNVRFDTQSGFLTAVEQAVLDGEASITVALMRLGQMTAAALPLPSSTEDIAFVD